MGPENFEENLNFVAAPETGVALLPDELVEPALIDDVPHVQALLHRSLEHGDLREVPPPQRPRVVDDPLLEKLGLVTERRGAELGER